MTLANSTLIKLLSVLFGWFVDSQSFKITFWLICFILKFALFVKKLASSDRILISRPPCALNCPSICFTTMQIIFQKFLPRTIFELWITF